MKTKYVSRTRGNRRLLLIFAGWSMDWRPFKGLKANGYDILVVWDYRSLTCNWKPLLAYDEICVLAWSMGVFAASVTMHELLPRITKRIAVNGTLWPIDDRRGIPEAIFHGTLAGLSPGNLRKFNRRMCLTREQYGQFCARKPARPFDEVLAELEAIETATIFHVEQVTEWDLAVVGRADAIFPAANQAQAWRGIAPVQMMQAGHLPDFQHLISRLFIDKNLVERRFSDSQATYASEAVVQHRISDRLHRMMTDPARGGSPATNGTIVEIGVGDGSLTRLYAPSHTIGTIHLWDIAPIDPALTSLADDVRITRCDAEVQIRRLPDRSVTSIISSSTLQWFNSPASFMRECARVLAPGGRLILSTFVHGNLHELYAVIGTGLQLPTANAWQSMLPPSLEVVMRHEGIEIETFDSPRHVLEHLRLTGVNAVSYGRSPLVLARRILSEYPRDLDGRCTLTYRPFFLIARKTEI